MILWQNPVSMRNTAIGFCDRIILLEYGKIIEDGSHEELMNMRGRYYEMYEVQSKYYQDDLNSDLSEESASFGDVLTVESSRKTSGENSQKDENRG